ncbi:MAG: immunoglobulin-like domain-containing protein [Cocleimonas sp.]
MSNKHILPEWAGFRSLWIVVAIILFILLLLMWLLGYGPGGRNCQVTPTAVNTAVEVPKVDAAKLISPDKSAPSLSLKDASIVRLIAGQSFTDTGATATDNIDGDVTVKVTGEVDTKTPGEYELVYTATDAAGNISTKTRKVIVEEKMKEVAIVTPDKTAPSLKLNGDSVVKISAGSNFTDQGAKATDAKDGDVKVTVNGNVDSKTQGEYTLTYTAVDAAGNKATTTRKVIVAAAASKAVVMLPATAKLYFENDDAEFPADTKLSLSAVTSYLRSNDSSTAVISGYHSATGNLARNQELSLERAQAVVKLLLESGIPAQRMRLEKPQKSEGSGSPEEARRVEVKVVN